MDQRPGRAAGWFARLDVAGRHAHATASAAAGHSRRPASASVPRVSRRRAAAAGAGSRGPCGGEQGAQPLDRRARRARRRSPARRAAATSSSLASSSDRPAATSARTGRRAPPTTAARARADQVADPHAARRRRRPGTGRAPGRPPPRISPRPAIATWSTTCEPDHAGRGRRQREHDDGMTATTTTAASGAAAAACRARNGRRPGAAVDGEGSGTPPWSQQLAGGGWQSARAWRSPERPSTRRGRREGPAPGRAAARRPVVDPGADARPAALRQRLRLRPRRRRPRPDRHRLGAATRAGRRSPPGWPRSAAASSDVRGVLVTHLHFDHLGLAERVRRGVGRLGRHAPGRRRGRRLARRATPRPPWPRRSSSSSRLGADRDEAVADVGPAENFERVHCAWPCPTGCSRTATSPTSPAGRCAPSTPRGTRPGHLCFAEERTGLFFSGDHVLPRISPNISTQRTRAAPTRCATTSTRWPRSRDRSPTEVLPAHEWRFRGSRPTGSTS